MWDLDCRIVCLVNFPSSYFPFHLNYFGLGRHITQAKGFDMLILIVNHANFFKHLKTKIFFSLLANVWDSCLLIHGITMLAYYSDDLAIDDELDLLMQT